MEDKRKAIISTAKKLFSEKGYSATGLREIAELSGISLGNIYNYFKNKEEIFNHTLDPKDIMSSLSDIPSLLNENLSKNFDKLLLTIKKVIDKNIELYRLIFIDLIEFGGSNTNRIVENIIVFIDDAFTKQIAEKDMIGSTMRNLDYKFFVKLFVVAAISVFVTNNILPSAKMDRYKDEEMASMISDVIMNGVLV